MSMTSVKMSLMLNFVCQYQSVGGPSVTRNYWNLTTTHIGPMAGGHLLQCLGRLSLLPSVGLSDEIIFQAE